MTVWIGFDDNQFVTEKHIRQNGEQGSVIGINGVEGDVTFAADLGIASTRRFEVDREWFDLGLRTVLGDFFG